MRTCEYGLCQRPVFGSDKTTRKGYCINHQFARKDLRPSLPKTKIVFEKEQSNELEVFYQRMMDTHNPVCENCGAYANWITAPFYKKLYRSAIAHVLPKRFFKSIDKDENNVLILFAGYTGVCDCHDMYDANWLSASRMNVWSKAVERFKILYPLILPEEYKFIPQLLLDTL